jgi:hypothetical protein
MSGEGEGYQMPVANCGGTVFGRPPAVSAYPFAALRTTRPARRNVGIGSSTSQLATGTHPTEACQPPTDERRLMT